MDRCLLVIKENFMKSESEFCDSLYMFCKEVGVPQSLVVDPLGEQTSNKMKKLCHQVGTTLMILEESTQSANRAEFYIGLYKEAIKKDMREANSPLVLWDYCVHRRSVIYIILLLETSSNSKERHQSRQP